MLAKQRYTKILELLDKDGIVHTAELVKLMGVPQKPSARTWSIWTARDACPGYTEGLSLRIPENQRIFRGDTFPFRSATPRTWSKKLPSHQRQPAW